MSQYTVLALCYDRLTSDVDYQSFADFYQKLFQKNGVAPETVLDLACGTGTMTGLLSELGYDMIGVDVSPEMLSVAREKAPAALLLNQRMEDLDLYGTVDAAVCGLDGINYALPRDLSGIFRRVHLFLNPGGVFVFDINTPEKLWGLDGGMFIDEDDDVYCVWRAACDPGRTRCRYGIDLFLREGDLWRRHAEEHIEYIHDPAALCGVLREAGFTDVRLYGDRSMNSPGPAEERIFLWARKPASCG